MAQVEVINTLSAEAAQRQFFHTCGVVRWAREMTTARPFANETALWQKAEAIWETMARAEWLEAFSHHPMIGDVESLRKKFLATAHLAGTEQSGVQGADEKTLQSLADGNTAYQMRFGYIFIVCATGKSAAEMLALLKARIGNDPPIELALAAGEQKKITRLRMEKIGA